MQKKCVLCGVLKLQSEFYRDAAFKSGFMSRCKSCRDEMTENWRNKNRAKYNADMRKYREDNPEWKWRRTLRTYGLSQSSYDSIRAAQNEKCALCEKDLKSAKKIVIDHCHDTGRVRGILCCGCNTGLGKFKDSVGSLEKAIKYLSK